MSEYITYSREKLICELRHIATWLASDTPERVGMPANADVVTQAVALLEKGNNDEQRIPDQRSS